MFSCKSKRRAGRVIAFAMFFGAVVGSVGYLFGDEAEEAEVTVQRAPRDDAPSDSCTDCGLVGGTVSAELADIRTCLCSVNQKLDQITGGDNATIESKLDVIDSEIEVLTSKVDVIDSDLADCCEDLNDKIGDITDTYDPGMTTVSLINSSTLSVIGWLKTIHAAQRGFVS